MRRWGNDICFALGLRYLFSGGALNITDVLGGDSAGGYVVFGDVSRYRAVEVLNDHYILRCANCPDTWCTGRQ